jgi:ketosteroid isomerase-like protein
MLDSLIGNLCHLCPSMANSYGEKMKLLPILVLLVISPIAIAQKSNPSALKEMVETEQAFSKTAEVKNTRDAFMEFIADDGLLFRPTAVNGKKWMNEHPVPPSDKHPLLAWQPVFAQMANAGDLGFTTGPWEFKADIKDEKPSGYGHFVTLWKKQTDGTWRFVVDLGISHPDSGGPLNIWKPEDLAKKRSFKAVDVEKTKALLVQRDGFYAGDVAKLGLPRAFRTYARKDTRLYLPDHLPYIGLEAATTNLEQTKGTVTVSYHPVSGDVSRSGDLGYTRGIYEKKELDKITEHGNYLRIWRKQGNTWQIQLDVTNPVP